MKSNADQRKERGKQTRQRIIDAALAIMIEDGPKCLTAGLITKRAEVSKAILFHHFNDLEDVSIAVFEEIFERFSVSMEGSRHKSVSDFVMQMGLGVINAPFSHRKISAAFLYFYERSAHNEVFRKLQVRTMELLLEHIRKNLESILNRPLSKDEVEVVPLLITMCLEGLGKFCIIFKDRSHLEAAWRKFSNGINELFERKN
ncbi:MAG: hypothetical protein OM95_11285 [Bdellovibrio sp. ArHS]|uniref:TetR/AcrR family transcriptional regulator n=1 Tax=Bdellovibrio sp. ArHS TaxID=1569284 RepID=UPI0005839CA2|nr:TetR/AcrR family transcriptional regulator [Bdellovibrio sp. ArHS]KHD88090.1 MAG: hypothetical protein OM95_11285 [Bdellovibrio sp. ArHS]